MLTILRTEEYKALSGISLNGNILDLGGNAKAQYQHLFRGIYQVTTANIDPAAKPDIKCNLEERLPIPDARYNAVLLVNVLEHIFEYRQLICECARILVPSGKIVIVVPFLFPYHPSPHDFHRYSKDALERTLAKAGFSGVSVQALGSGLFAARWSMVERLLPRPLFWVLSFCFVPLTRVLDALLARTARILGKGYEATDYALGFVATAVKK